MNTFVDLNPLLNAIEIVGSRLLLKTLGVSKQTLFSWKSRGLPRSEWTGETNYAEQIEQLTNGQVTRTQLLEWKQSNFFKPTTTNIAPG